MNGRFSGSSQGYRLVTNYEGMNMSPQYLIDCPKCGSPALTPCRSLTRGRVTDTHAVRVQAQFDNPDRATVIRRAIYDVYGSFMAEACTRRIDENWQSWSHPDNRDELMMYLWMNSSGGGVADYAANKIRKDVKVWESK